MERAHRGPSARRVAGLALATLAALVLLAPALLTPLAAARVRAVAARRGLDARWSALAWRWPLGLEWRELVLERHDTHAPVVRAARVEAALGWSLPSLRLRLSALVLDDAGVTLPAASEDEPERRPSTEPEGGGPAAPRVRAAAEQLARALLLPARDLPVLRVRALDVQRGDSLFARFDALTLTHAHRGAELAVTGVLASEHRVPFDAVLDWRADDRLQGRASFRLGEPSDASATLIVTVDGHVSQDRREGRLRIAEGTRLRVGTFDASVSGDVSRRGPRFRATVEAHGVDAEALRRGLPRAMLGPLASLPVRGTFDWQASLDVDVADPGASRFTAAVTPHGLVLGPDATALPLHRLAEPFVAEIHVPRGTVMRDLSPANPGFRTLAAMGPWLPEAVLTNEDGGFRRHRGFNPGAIQDAIADNLRAGAFRRGAGTITMQLARNLFLGHRRTLSRKGQEVVLAWVLEHLTGLSKDRLLEIYLNIIEWGPDVHGAAEAARYYFDRDPADLTLDEALFLTVLVPSPTRWRTRVDAQGELRPWAREQMAFIARKMSTRGVIAPEQVPDAAQLHVTLRGAAAALFAPADTLAVPGDTPPPE
jgi:hypothetical protein